MATQSNFFQLQVEHSMQCDLILNSDIEKSALYLNRSPDPCSLVAFHLRTHSAMQQLMVAPPRWNKSLVT